MKVVHQEKENDEDRYVCFNCGETYDGRPSLVDMVNIDMAYNCEATYVTMDDLQRHEVEVFICEEGCMSEDESDFPPAAPEGEWMCGNCESEFDEKYDAINCCAELLANA